MLYFFSFYFMIIGIFFFYLIAEIFRPLISAHALSYHPRWYLKILFNIRYQAVVKKNHCVSVLLYSTKSNVSSFRYDGEFYP